jgi:hypothetical protein
MSVARRSTRSHRPISTPLSQGPGHLLNILGGFQSIRRRLLGRLDDLVELLRGGGELLFELVRRLDLGDLPPRAGDRLAHLHEFGEDIAGRVTVLIEHRRFEPGDSLEQHVGLGGAAAAGIFGEEPASPRRGPQRLLQRGKFLGKGARARLLRGRGV